MELPIDTSDDETPNEYDSVPGGWVCEEFKPKLGVKSEEFNSKRLAETGKEELDSCLTFVKVQTYR